MTDDALRQPSALPDRFALVWAIACAVHCMVLPLVLFAIPSLYLALYSFEAPHRAAAMTLLRLISLEPWFILAGALISGLALGRGAWRHRRMAPPALGGAGIGLLGASWLWAGAAGGWVHSVGVLAGGTALALAHAWNLHLVRHAAGHR